MSAINVRLDTFKHSDYTNILEAFAPSHDIYLIFVYLFLLHTFTTIKARRRKRFDRLTG
jgi:hypothetical protein